MRKRGGNAGNNPLPASEKLNIGGTRGASPPRDRTSWRSHFEARGTGAAEYTEADVSANGGLQFGPPWIEGIIQRQGVPIDRTKPGVGNTIIPANGSPKAYLDGLLWAVETFKKKPASFAAYQASSVEISRVLEALLTGAEYLRHLSAAF
jgi:hypothetical protein